MSRKVRVALATVVAAYLANWFQVSDTTVYAILSVGVAVIGGIAIEDNGVKSRSVPAFIDVSVLPKTGKTISNKVGNGDGTGGNDTVGS